MLIELIELIGLIRLIDFARARQPSINRQSVKMCSEGHVQAIRGEGVRGIDSVKAVSIMID